MARGMAEDDVRVRSGREKAYRLWKDTGFMLSGMNGFEHRNNGI